jgi:hypothetical protein
MIFYYTNNFFNVAKETILLSNSPNILDLLLLNKWIFYSRILIFLEKRRKFPRKKWKNGTKMTSVIIKK